MTNLLPRAGLLTLALCALLQLPATDARAGATADAITRLIAMDGRATGLALSAGILEQAGAEDAVPALALEMALFALAAQ